MLTIPVISLKTYINIIYELYPEIPKEDSETVILEVIKHIQAELSEHRSFKLPYSLGILYTRTSPDGDTNVYFKSGTTTSHKVEINVKL